MELSREEKIAQFRATATGQTTPAAPASNAAEAPAPEAGTPAAAPATPPAEAAPSGAPAQETAPVPSRWRRKVKALDEEHDLDLESMPDAKLDELLGKALSYDTVKERYRARRDEALETVDREKAASARATSEWWQKQLLAQGYKYESDASGNLRLTPPQKQTAPTAGDTSDGQTDWDALEREISETGDAATIAKALRKMRSQVGGPPPANDPDAVKREVAAQMQLVESQKQARDKFQHDLNEAYRVRAADFDAAGPNAERFRQLARERALAASYAPGATPESVLRAVHETAEIAKSVAAARPAAAPVATAPRAKAPTVIPSGSAPAPAATDPAKIDGSTPEGRKQRIEWLKNYSNRHRGAAQAV